MASFLNQDSAVRRPSQAAGSLPGGRKTAKEKTAKKGKAVKAGADGDDKNKQATRVRDFCINIWY